MASIGMRIRNRREELNMTQEELAKRLGYKNKSTIAKIEIGKNDITQSKVEKFAKALDTTIAYLMGWDSDTPTPTKAVKIPVLGTVPCGTPVEAIEDIIGWEELPASEVKDGEYFGLVTKGLSMYPEFKEGDIAIVKKQTTADSGQYIIAKVDGEDATLKKYIRHDDCIELVPINPEYPPMKYSMKEVESLPVVICGVVVKNVRNYL